MKEESKRISKNRRKSKSIKPRKKMEEKFKRKLQGMKTSQKDDRDKGQK